MDKKPPNLEQLKKMAEDLAADEGAKSRETKFRNSLKNALRMSQQLKQVSHDLSQQMNPNIVTAGAASAHTASKDLVKAQNAGKWNAQSKDGSILSYSARDKFLKPQMIEYD